MQYNQSPYQQQGYPGYNPPPRPPDNTRLVVIIILVIGGVMAIAGGFFFIKMATGKQQAENRRHRFYKAPPVQGNSYVLPETRDEDADCIADYSGCSEQVQGGSTCRTKLEIKAQTEQLIGEIRQLRMSLNRRLDGAGTDKDETSAVCAAFFIEEERAAVLHRKIDQYLRTVFELTGEQQISDGYYVVLQIGDRYMGSAGTHGRTSGWENDHFGRDLAGCRNSMNVLYRELREFERNRVAAVQ